mmetsp:Transcript_40572/g.101927  ORF Transcript_40572/g.101927 Transcript_40572/m.101927 type:complete len:231 (+) Transcript_40572:73-765(+)
MAVSLERAEQDAKMSTHFHKQQTFEAYRCRRKLSSSAVGRAGGAGQLMRTAEIIGEPSTKLNAFHQNLNEAIVKGNLTKIYQVWAAWIGGGEGDVPLDNREVGKVRVEAVRIGIRRLRAAMNSHDSEQIEKCVQIVDTATRRWPFPRAITASLEYQAAVQHVQEASAARTEAPALGQDWEEQDEDEDGAAPRSPRTGHGALQDEAASPASSQSTTDGGAKEEDDDEEDAF